MPEAPQFSIVPPVRCCQLLEDPSPHYCGELAAVVRPGPTYWFDEFFCLAHGLSSDVAIAELQPFRRVHLVVDVYFAAVSVAPGLAHTEAVARLEQAVGDAGGVVSVQAVRSTVGRDGVRRVDRRGNGAWTVQR